MSNRRGRNDVSKRKTKQRHRRCFDVHGTAQWMEHVDTVVQKSTGDVGGVGRVVLGVHWPQFTHDGGGHWCVPVHECVVFNRDETRTEMGR